MSPLQKLIKSLITIIVSYKESQCDNQAPPLYILLSKSTEELNTLLEKLIKEATHNYETRAPVLNYFFYVIKKIKPLVDQSQLLNDSEVKFIKEILVKLVINMQSLMNNSHNTKIDIKYDNESIPMYGFVRGIIMQYSLSNSAQIIEANLFKPFGLNKHLSEKEVELIIHAIIDDHQKEKQPIENPFAEENKVLKQEIVIIKETLFEMQKNFTVLYRAVSEIEKINAELASLKNAINELNLKSDTVWKDKLGLEQQIQSQEARLKTISFLQLRGGYNPLFLSMKNLETPENEKEELKNNSL